MWALDAGGGRRVHRSLYSDNTTAADVVARARRISMEALCDPETSFYDVGSDACVDKAVLYGTEVCLPGQHIKDATGERSSAGSILPRECMNCSAGRIIGKDTKCKDDPLLKEFCPSGHPNTITLGEMSGLNLDEYTRFELKIVRLYENGSVLVDSTFSDKINSETCQKHKTIKDCPNYMFTSAFPSSSSDRRCHPCKSCPSGKTRAPEIKGIMHDYFKEERKWKNLQGVENAGMTEEFNAFGFISERFGTDVRNACDHGGRYGDNDTNGCQPCAECECDEEDDDPQTSGSGFLKYCQTDGVKRRCKDS
jgi:hypothetical protein